MYACHDTLLLEPGQFGNFCIMVFKHTVGVMKLAAIAASLLGSNFQGRAWSCLHSMGNSCHTCLCILP